MPSKVKRKKKVTDIYSLARPEYNEVMEAFTDLRQQKFWEMYLNPKSHTFTNAYQSAIRAGYEESYAKVVTTRKFFVDKIRRISLVPRAEVVLEKALTMNTTDKDGMEQADLLRIQTDVAKHITKTLGKDDYAERSEVTGKNGGEIRVAEIIFNAPTITGVKEEDKNDESRDKPND